MTDRGERDDPTAAAPDAEAFPRGGLAPEPVVVRDLPCVHCRYNLRGLPLLAECPECGVPVRLTIAAALDPEAENLERLFAPTLTAVGLVVWSGAALAAAAALWAERGASLLRLLASVPPPAIDLGAIGVGATLCSGAGALVLVRPHRGITPRRSLLTLFGVLLYLPLAYVVGRLFDTDPLAQLAGVRPIAAHAWWRGAFAALVSAIILILRPPAVRLAMRSLVVRTGRVDRQPMWTLIPPVFLSFAGELLLLASAHAGVSLGSGLRLAAVLTIVVGATLFTIGLAGIVVDTWRLRSVIAGRDVLSVFEALGTPRPHDAAAAGTVREDI